MKNNLSRRKFFGNLTKSTIGIAVLASIPIKLVAGDTGRKKIKFKLKIHPSSVKRNK